MLKEEALVDKEYLLEKFPGKGGWTYAKIPEVPLQKHSPFGWAKVKGFIDSYELKSYKLMPMGDGSLFLPVKAQIRKKLKKEAGDKVHVILYEDELPTEVPQEILDCLENEPEANEQFWNLTDDQRRFRLNIIYSAKSDETKAKNIVRMIEELTSK
ncbi:MAG: DUF1905 domain-containing protein [Reichenbachiella sp.]